MRPRRPCPRRDRTADHLPMSSALRVARPRRTALRFAIWSFPGSRCLCRWHRYLFCSQLLTERLSNVAPEGLARRLGLQATGLGEVFHYVVTYRGIDFSVVPEAERVVHRFRLLHDWVIGRGALSARRCRDQFLGGMRSNIGCIDPPARQVWPYLQRSSRPWPRTIKRGGGNLRQGDRPSLSGLGRTSNEDQIEQDDRDGATAFPFACATRPSQVGRR